MPMIFGKCKVCHRDRELFRLIGICSKCYQDGKTHERQIKLACTSLTKGSQVISAGLTCFELVHAMGLMGKLRCAALSEEFLGYLQEFQGRFATDEDLQMELEATEELSKQAQLIGAVQDDSLEESPRLIEAQEQVDQTVKQAQALLQPAKEDQKKRDEEKAGEINNGAPKDSSVSEEDKKGPFETGKKAA